MKKILLSLGLLLLGSLAHAGLPEWNYIPRSSFTSAGNPGVMTFSTVPIQFVGMTVGVKATGNVAIYRSTSPTFYAGITTQTVMDTGDQTYFFPMFDMRNTSYTYIYKSGGAAVTLWFRCVGTTKDQEAACPGLSVTGR